MVAPAQQDAVLQRSRLERHVLRIPRRHARPHRRRAHRRARELRDGHARVRRGVLREPYRARARGARIAPRPGRRAGRVLARGRRDVRVREARAVVRECLSPSSRSRTEAERPANTAQIARHPKFFREELKLPGADSPQSMTGVQTEPKH